MVSPALGELDAKVALRAFLYRGLVIRFFEVRSGKLIPYDAC